MGFAPVAAVAILFIAVLASFATYNVQTDAADREIRAAAQDAAAREAARAHTDFVITNIDHVPVVGRLTIDLQNDGNNVLDTQDIEVLVDGQLRTSSIISTEVEGDAVRYWAPGQDVELVLIGFLLPPDRVAVVAGTGVAAYEVL